MSRSYIGALDQGTSSTRFLIFETETGQLITFDQREVHPLYPRDGWVEVDPMELLSSSLECIEGAVNNLSKICGVEDAGKLIKTIGVTNQRETTVLWSRSTGRPLHNALVWSDCRTASLFDEVLAGKDKCAVDSMLIKWSGLPLSTYPCSLKIVWMCRTVEQVREALENDDCMFGTVDSWLVWNLTGRKSFVTDVTNASRTQLMNLTTCRYEPKLLKFFKISSRLRLPEIRSSAESYGSIESGCLRGVPISGILGDQQAALVGQLGFDRGAVKNTYGTGCFLLYNTGEGRPVLSKSGLLSTVAYQLGPTAPVHYALEGAVAVAGSCVRWLRDQLKFFDDASEIERLANQVQTTGGVHFVPAFSGLLCPHMDPSARAVICGLSQSVDRRHICRAALEAVCFQTREILLAMERDSAGSAAGCLSRLKTDGGMTANNLLMQLQADLSGVDVERSTFSETTAFGAAIAAALGTAVWDLERVKAFGGGFDRFRPQITAEEREARFAVWMLAVNRSKNWLNQVEETNSAGKRSRPFNFVVSGAGPGAVLVVGVVAAAVVGAVAAAARWGFWHRSFRP